MSYVLSLAHPEILGDTVYLTTTGCWSSDIADAKRLALHDDTITIPFSGAGEQTLLVEFLEVEDDEYDLLAWLNDRSHP